MTDLDKSEPRFWNRLYRNLGNWKFEDVTEKAGVKGLDYDLGVTTGDYDNDGFTDMFVAGLRRNTLFRNRGDGTFEDVSAKAGFNKPDPQYGTLWAVAAAFLDYDNDGKLDLFVSNYCIWDPKTEPLCGPKGMNDYCHPNNYKGLPNSLFRNNGDGTFTDVSVKSGIRKVIGKGMGIGLADYDADGFVDIFVANDTEPNYLFHNLKNGSFEEIGFMAGVGYPEAGKPLSGMGADARDIDDDGKPDIFHTALSSETMPVFRNQGNMTFVEITARSGVSSLSLSRAGWSNAIVDLNNDGRKDLFVAGGDVMDPKGEFHEKVMQTNLVMANLGKFKFADATAGAGPELLEEARHPPRRGFRRPRQRRPRRRRRHRTRRGRRGLAQRQPGAQPLAAAESGRHQEQPRRRRDRDHADQRLRRAAQPRQQRGRLQQRLRHARALRPRQGRAGDEARAEVAQRRAPAAGERADEPGADREGAGEVTLRPRPLLLAGSALALAFAASGTESDVRAQVPSRMREAPEPPPPPPGAVPTVTPTVRFSDVAGKSQFSYTSNNDYREKSRKYFPQPMCGGVAILDYDRDGKLDVFFTNGGKLPDYTRPDPSYYSCLLRGRGDGTFEEVTLKAKVEGKNLDISYGVAAGDFDNDGFPDLFIANAGANALYRNNGDGTFSEVTAGSGLDTQAEGPAVGLRRVLRLRQRRPARPRRLALHLLDAEGRPRLPDERGRDLLLPGHLPERQPTASTATWARGSSRT